MTTKRMGYRAALAWLLDNDDCDWMHDLNPNLSISACLVCDIYGKPWSKVVDDLLRLQTETETTTNHVND